MSILGFSRLGSFMYCNRFISSLELFLLGMLRKIFVVQSSNGGSGTSSHCSGKVHFARFFL